MPLRDRPARRHLRLTGWDYRTPGAYAITIVTRNREWLFGDVVDDRMVLNDAGVMVETTWRESPGAFPRVAIDAFVVMPNHVHAIVILGGPGPTGNPTLSDVVHRFKSVTTLRYSDRVGASGWPPYDRTLWQPRFYDHIVRGDADLDRCRRYIESNPANWEADLDREPKRWSDRET